jgi:hypothetical protein
LEKDSPYVKRKESARQNEHEIGLPVERPFCEAHGIDLPHLGLALSAAGLIQFQDGETIGASFMFELNFFFFFFSSQGIPA